MSMQNIEDIYELSPMQQGMLFHTLSEPDRALYILQIRAILEGSLDPIAFKQAWRKVLENNPVFRTSFHYKELPKPLQVVNRKVALPWLELDWRNESHDEQKRLLDAFLSKDRLKGFDPSQAPLLRLTLIRLGTRTYQFLWTCHHLLMDGWCLPLIMREVLTGHDALRAGRSVTHKRARPYKDYIQWLQGRDRSEEESFWRNELNGLAAPALLLEKTVAPISSNDQEGYGDIEVSLSTEIRERIIYFSRQHQLTPNTIMQGAWALLLSRYSGQDDVMYGATVSGRPADLEGVETMIGLFINTLPVRVRLNANEPASAMLKRLQSRLAEMRQYETSPLVQIQGWGELPRGLPLFDSIVVYENYPIDPATPSQGSSLRIREVQYTNKNNFPITLVIMPGASFILRLTFDLARIDRSTAEGLLLNYTALLRDVLERPSARISDLRMQEGAQAQAGGDEDRNDRYADLSVHELFQLQAEMRPDDVAIVFEEERLTYSELNRQSNQVASFLVEAGVEPGSVVALFQRRSARSLVSLLGALKTGSAYLPIDVSQPDKRIALVLEDAMPGVIITDRSLVERVGDNDIRKICIDTQWPEISACSQANPPRRTMPGDAVYVVYTSGSTGRPKGVVVEHRSVVNYILAIRDRMHIGQDCAMALLQPLSVDMGNTVIFPSLCFGGCLHIISEEKVIDPEAFGEYIQARSIDVLKVTPSHLSSLQKSNSPWRVMPRKALILGGESSRKEWVERLYELAPECRVFNHYGPTETTVGVLTHAIDRNGSSKSSGVVPIGRPLPNCEAYVLSRGLQLLPAGVEGELYIGGRCLARGYLNNPEMTAQKFIPNPFSNQPGSRLYKTGDLARLLPDGNFEFLGRVDDQIKVRGFRVEPKEIEAVALQQPEVEEAVVMGREDASGEMRLVCYGVTRGGDESASARLLAHLRERLPEYMIPTAIILLDKMPLTPNGKVDRDRLPLPDQSKSQSNAEYVAPRIQIEEVLAGLWSAMLDVKNVGVYDDFFSLGGHSLNMTEMAFRVNEAFQVDLPLRQVFEAQTIESLATAIVRRQAETMDEERVDRILSEIEHMSEEEARHILSN